MTDKIVIFSTCEKEEDARRVAEHLVQRRLAACVNIVPGATSVYRWKGTIEATSEFILIIKSRRDLVESIEQELAAVHPYEVPELIALPIVDGGKAYLAWLGNELNDSTELG